MISQYLFLAWNLNFWKTSSKWISLLESIVCLVWSTRSRTSWSIEQISRASTSNKLKTKSHFLNPSKSKDEFDLQKKEDEYELTLQNRALWLGKDGERNEMIDRVVFPTDRWNCCRFLRRRWEQCYRKRLPRTVCRFIGGAFIAPRLSH